MKAKNTKSNHEQVVDLAEIKKQHNPLVSKNPAIDKSQKSKVSELKKLPKIKSDDIKYNPATGESLFAMAVALDKASQKPRALNNSKSDSTLDGKAVGQKTSKQNLNKSKSESFFVHKDRNNKMPAIPKLDLSKVINDEERKQNEDRKYPSKNPKAKLLKPLKEENKDRFWRS